MGLYAYLYNPTKAKIPEEKYDEVAERMKVLLTRLGAMNLHEVKLYDESFCTISFPEYDENDNIFMDYNYFDECSWERTGYIGHRHKVVSNKVGGRFFNACVLALYTLEGLYLDGPTIVMENSFVLDRPYIAMINSIFHESYISKNEDSWPMIVTYHDDPDHDDPDYDYDFRPSDFSHWPSEKYGTGYRGVSQAITITRGVLYASFYLDDYFEGITPEPEDGENIRKAFWTFKKNADKSENKREEAFRIARKFSGYLDFRKYLQNGESFDKAFMDGSEEEELNTIFSRVSTYPVELVKCISETFGVDFWDLYEEIREYMENPFHLDSLDTPVLTATVQEVYYAIGVDDEEFIPYYKIYDDVEIEDKTIEELKGYRKKLDEVRKDFCLPDNALKWLIGVISGLNKNFPSLPIFNTFFEDSLANIGNEKFMAIWKLIENEFVDRSGKAHPSSSEEHRKFKLLSGTLGNRVLRKEIFGF